MGGAKAVIVTGQVRVTEPPELDSSTTTSVSGCTPVGLPSYTPSFNAIPGMAPLWTVTLETNPETPAVKSINRSWPCAETMGTAARAPREPDI